MTKENQDPLKIRLSEAIQALDQESANIKPVDLEIMEELIDRIKERGRGTLYQSGLNYLTTAVDHDKNVI